MGLARLANRVRLVGLVHDDPNNPLIHQELPGGSINDVYNPKTGKTWMNKNLGATRVATSPTDAAAFGDLYQWGRLTDGHEKRTSGTTTNVSSSNVPGHGNFILRPNFPAPFSWNLPISNNLWQGVNGPNNPCPSGYRIPTDGELAAERLSWVTDDAAGAFASPLKWTLAGNRTYANGQIINSGLRGSYWSSHVICTLPTEAQVLVIIINFRMELLFDALKTK